VTAEALLAAQPDRMPEITLLFNPISNSLMRELIVYFWGFFF